jgi:hypothetical protein
LGGYDEMLFVSWTYGYLKLLVSGIVEVCLASAALEELCSGSSFRPQKAQSKAEPVL